MLRPPTPKKWNPNRASHSYMGVDKKPSKPKLHKFI